MTLLKADEDDEDDVYQILKKKLEKNNTSSNSALGEKDLLRKGKEMMRKQMLDRIANAEVIGATLQVATNIKDKFHINAKFVCILVDEATQTNEANILLVVKKECKRLVLVGDQNQLGPVISDNSLREGYNSVFERMVKEGHEYIMLDTQYRMHPSIASNSSMLFYGGGLNSGISQEQRTLYKSLQEGIFVKGDPRLLVNVKGREVKVGDSYKND